MHPAEQYSFRGWYHPVIELDRILEPCICHSCEITSNRDGTYTIRPCEFHKSIYEISNKNMEL